MLADARPPTMSSPDRENGGGQAHAGGQVSFSGVSFYKGTNPIKAPLLMISSKSNYLPKDPLPNTIALGAKALLAYEYQGGRNI